MIRLSKPYLNNINFDEIKAIFDSGMMVSGAKVREFEQKIADFLNYPGSISCVNSGTAALHTAILALDLPRGSEVVIPSFTFPSLANVIELSGLKIKLVDIDFNTISPSIELTKQAVSNNTSLVVWVYQYGNVTSITSLFEFLKNRGVKIIEDAACAFGATVDNQPIGMLSDAACFSFHPRKIVTTGEGGAVLSIHPEIIKRVNICRNQGQQTVNNQTQFVCTGYNYRLGELNAVIGLSQLEFVTDFIEQRKEIVKKYVDLLKENPNISIPGSYTTGNSVYQNFAIVLDEKIDRQKVISHLRANSVEASIAGYAIHLQPYYKNKYNFNESEFPISAKFHYHAMSLPLYPGLSDVEIQKTVHLLSEAINEQRGDK